MRNYTIFWSSKILGEAGKQEIFQKILDLKSSSEQIIFRKLSLGAPDGFLGSLKMAKENKVATTNMTR